MYTVKNYSNIFISMAFGPRQCGHFITTSPHSLHTHLWPHGTNACVLGRSKHIQHVAKSSLSTEEVDFFFSVMVETWDGFEGLVWRRFLCSSRREDGDDEGVNTLFARWGFQTRCMTSSGVSCPRGLPHTPHFLTFDSFFLLQTRHCHGPMNVKARLEISTYDSSSLLMISTCACVECDTTNVRARSNTTYQRFEFT